MPVVISLLFNAYAVAQDHNAAISGRLIDKSGASIATASVLVFQWHREPTGKFDLRQFAKTVTNSKGEFSKSLQPGSYEVFAAARGFLPSATRVRVGDKGSTNISIQMQVDASAAPGDACCDAQGPERVVPDR